MLRQSVRAVAVIAAVACMLTVDGAAQNAAPLTGVQKKTALKKSARKSPVVRTDSVPAAALPAPDSLKADTSSPASALFSFVVAAEPESVQVLLDDSLRGFAPCSLSGVAPGGHVLTLKKRGYYLKKAEIVVDSALPRDLSFVLLKPALLRVTSDPAGARLYLDGKEEGATPYENDKVRPGDHMLRVEMRNRTPGERTLTVKSGGSDTVHFTLDYTSAYRDSVETANRAAEKLRKDRFVFTAVSALFCLCGIVLIIIEANSN
ncbi:MAG: PEGA domain-containing protein [Chitinispirillaceae bacterium]|nr:PEGA domain-containing protein [Chitinispirillaceae bacterium]